jgi:hypothetical protein
MSGTTKTRPILTYWTRFEVILALIFVASAVVSGGSVLSGEAAIRAQSGDACNLLSG